MGELAEEHLLRGDVRASCYSSEVVAAPLLPRIVAVFDRATRSRGASYASSGHVLGLTLHSRTAEARVLGTRAVPYLVTVACPVSAPDRLRASCSCPMGVDRIPCKHVYAVLARLDVQRVDLGTVGQALRIEIQDPREAQQSLGLRVAPAVRGGGDGGARDEGPGVDGPGEEDAVYDVVDDEVDDDPGLDDDPELDDGPELDDDPRGYRPRLSRSLAIRAIVPPRRALASHRPGGADLDWRRRLDWLPDAPIAAVVPHAASEIEIIVGPAAWIDERGEPCPLGSELTVSVYRRTRRRDGALGPRAMLELGDDRAGQVSAEDRRLIDLLLGCTPSFYQPRRPYSYHVSPRPDEDDRRRYLTGATIHPSAAVRVLPVLCASGRLGWLGPPSVGEPPARGARELRPLRWDGDVSFVAQLRAEPAGRGIALRLELARDGEIVPADRVAAFASAGWLITDDRLIRVEGCDDLGRWMAAAGRSPLRLPARELGVVIEKIGNAPRAPRLVLDALGWAVTPGTPVLRLYVEPIPRTTRLGARVAFRYGQVEAVGTAALVIDARSRQVVLRELAAEAAARAQLMAADLGWIAQPPGADHELTIEVARFLDRASAMQDLGWELWVRGRRLRRGGRLKVDVETGIDWFDVSVDLDVEGLGADLPELLQALRDGQPFVPLTDGTMGIVLPEWLAGHARLAALGTLSHGAVRVPRAAAPLLDAMLATLPDVEIDAAFRRLRARLAAATAIRPCREPRSFRGELRPYQRDALGWFRFLDEVGLGGCLADDMGLGKTVQVLAALAAARRSGRPSLVIAPKTVVFNWLDEVRRFAPRLRVVDYTGPDRAARRAAAAGADLVVTSYPILRLDADELATWDLEWVVLDEAQAIKNPEARVTQAARGLRARRRLALTGTPVENHLGDLASILEFLNPGLTDASDALRALLSTRPGDAADLSPLARALRPFLLRRTKDQVLPDLPARTEQVLRCQLGADQRRHYDELLAHYRAALLPQVAREGMARSTMHVLEALLRLRQAACHPGLIDPRRGKAASAKLDALLEHVAEATESGHKALVFSQFTSFLALVRARLDAGGISYEYLDGQTRDRKQCVARFHGDPSCKLFLISLKAGGTGLNLTAADYVYLLDPWWNPAVEAQAIDRTHRPGQIRPVFAYRLIAENTVEDKILELQARKRQLADGIFADGGGGLAKLSIADLLE
jgi:superfamily II DNA or RNA helicase